MVKTAIAYVVAGLALCLALFSWLDANGARESVAAKEQALEIVGHSNDSLKALSAEYWAAHTKPRIDTVRQYVARYITVRDSVTRVGTVVPELGTVIAAADSTIAECVSLANACEVQRSKDAALIESVTIEAQGWKRLYETTKYPRCGRRCGIAIGILGTVAAAVAVNQMQNAAGRR